MASQNSSLTVDATEHTALLQSKKAPPPPPPLPWRQLSILLLIQLCEPMTSTSIFPYVNQMVGELDIIGGDERKIGYYAGMESLFFLTEAATMLQWSRASDTLGRKPIILIGLFGTALSIFSFGLSRSLPALILSRCLCGLLSANVGVMKSSLGDITTTENRAAAFMFLPVVWAFGISLGGLIGGSLARPHDRFPESRFFSLQLWLKFPYFLPSLVVGVIVMLVWGVVLLCFQETVSRKSYKGTAEHGSVQSTGHINPLPLHRLLTPHILIPIFNYASMAFLNTSIVAILPLFCAMPIAIGGLGLSTPEIGAILSAYGAATGTIQILFFLPLLRCLGEKRLFLSGPIFGGLIFVLLPIMNLIARIWGMGVVVYALLAVVVLLLAGMEPSFGAVYLFINAAAPTSSRGTVNGLSQTFASLARAIGPAFCTSLFSLSVEHNLLGGGLVYVVFMFLGCGGVVLGGMLPSTVQENVE